MPWLYFALKARHRAWAEAWQAEVQAQLLAQETVQLGTGCFIAPDAAIFGEPGRAVVLGDRCAIAAQAFLHGPLTLGNDVSINAGVRLDGGRKGLLISDGTRIDGIKGLRDLTLRKHEMFAEVVVENLLTYAIGRGLDYNDMPLVRSLTHDAAKHDYRFSSLIMGVVQSPVFTMNLKSAAVSTRGE